MGILTIPPREIYPKKPYNILYSTQLNVSTYGTVLDITSGRGIVSAVYAASQDVIGSAGFRSAANLRFRITIDGIETTVTGSYPEFIAVFPTTKTERQFVLTTPLYFLRTCKIEVQNHQNANDLIYCTVQYGLE